MKQWTSLLTATFLIIAYSLDAELKFEQQVTISNLQSSESVAEEARAFCKAAAGDPDIAIIGIKYDHEKVDEHTTWYNAIITCYVSKVDEDIWRIEGKMIQQDTQKAAKAP